MKRSNDLLTIEWTENAVTQSVAIGARNDATCIDVRHPDGGFLVHLPNDPNVLLALAIALETRVYMLYNDKARDTAYSDLRGEWAERLLALLPEFANKPREAARLQEGHSALLTRKPAQLGLWVERVRADFFEILPPDAAFCLRTLVDEISYYDEDK